MTKGGNYACFATAPSRVATSWTQTNFSTGWPSLKMIIVGIDIIRNWVGTWGSLSTLCFMTFAVPPTFPASSSRRGSIIWHGPHHSAQKSTRVTPVAILVTKAASVETRVAIKSEWKSKNEKYEKKLLFSSAHCIKKLCKSKNIYENLSHYSTSIGMWSRERIITLSSSSVFSSL